ncbi:MAG: hypothetical protein KDD60_00305 [Bdellovibrionales bacterium]|nr:hypothetical protein [Bdellovibrionales bacterium]
MTISGISGSGSESGWGDLLSKTLGGTSSGNSSSNTALNIANTAVDVYHVLDSKAPADVKAQAAKERISLAVADYYTFGLASVAYGAMNRAFPGFMEKLRKLDRKFDPVLRLVGKLFGSKQKWKTEGNRLADLEKKGIQIPEELQGARKLTHGRTKEELVDRSVPADFVGFKEDGTWTNNKFAISRDEKDLKPEDIWGYSAFFEKFGNDWLGKFSGEDRRAIAEKALELNCVKEHHGTIDISWSPELENFAKTLTGAV